VLHGHRDLVLAVEGDVAREHLEEDDAERVEIALGIDVLAQGLLGRDVVGGAQHAAVRRQPLLGQRAGDAEVRDLGRALLVDEDVLGLDVAVDDAVVVGGAQRAGDLDGVGHRLADGQAPVAADAVLEGLPFDVLEDDVRRAQTVRVLVPFLAGVDDADDVRMVELRHRARLAAEALELVGVRRDLTMHELDRNLALEHRVERAVDRRHAAVADLCIEPVAPVEQSADLRGHRWIVRIWAAFMSGTARQLRDGWSGTGIPYTGGDHASRVPSMAGAQGARRPGIGRTHRCAARGGPRLRARPARPGVAT
jgi:hypothetical protein